MPLHDHFRPPWSVARPWEGFHSAWAAAIAFHLNSGLLPPDYFAMPMLQVTGRVEVDVGTFQGHGAAGGAPPNGAAVYAPPQPTLSVPLSGVNADSFEVQVLRNFGGPQLRAALELVSPANKDRAGHRRAFAGKCVEYLRRGVSVIVVDIVTERLANLHAEIVQALEQGNGPVWESATHLYAAAYRSVLNAEAAHVDAWTEVLTLGAPLPELPLWLEPDLCIPLPLEESYTNTCGSLRMRNGR